jgi:hypothetical protein
MEFHNNSHPGIDFDMIKQISYLCFISYYELRFQLTIS